jgi:hypothetical protein
MRKEKVARLNRRGVEMSSILLDTNVLVYAFNVHDNHTRKLMKLSRRLKKQPLDV